MQRNTIKTILLVTGIALFLLPTVTAVAKDKDDDSKKAKPFVIGDEFENISIESDGSEWVITMTEDGKEKVAIVDMDQVGIMVSETVSEFTSALAEMQMEFRLGNDNTFSFALEDEEWEVDFNEIMSEVAEALSESFDDFDTDDWGHHRQYRSHENDSGEDLEDEIADLRAELKNLKKELAQLKKQSTKK